VNPNRNDPCPCGSGKKYKKCCLAGVEPRFREVRQLSQATDALMSDVLSFAAERWGVELVERAWADYHQKPPGSPDLPPLEDHPEEDLFAFWYVLDWIAGEAEADGNPGPTRPLLQACLAEADPNGTLHDFAELLSQTYFSVFEVESRDGSGRVVLRDQLLGQTCEVWDRELADAVLAESLVLARLLPMTEGCALAGIAPYSLPPEAAEVVTELREALTTVHTTLDASVLREESRQILAEWREQVAAFDDALPDELAGAHEGDFS